MNIAEFSYVQLKSPATVQIFTGGPRMLLGRARCVAGLRPPTPPALAAARTHARRTRPRTYVVEFQLQLKSPATAQILKTGARACCRAEPGAGWFAAARPAHTRADRWAHARTRATAMRIRCREITNHQLQFRSPAVAQFFNQGITHGAGRVHRAASQCLPGLFTSAAAG